MAGAAAQHALELAAKAQLEEILQGEPSGSWWASRPCIEGLVYSCPSRTASSQRSSQQSAVYARGCQDFSLKGEGEGVERLSFLPPGPRIRDQQAAHGGQLQPR